MGERSMNRKKLVLIDGHAILHRAFHALPPSLTSPDGTPTNAIHGFTNMMIRILIDMKPDFLIVAFDLPAPNFRQQIYTQYQEKRPEMVGNLSEQIPIVHTLLDHLKIPYFEIGGFEADDCIGTLAKQATSNKGGVETVIVTGDRDMLQLINESVRVCVPVKGLSETKTYDIKLIEEEFGVKPSQWVDVKALKGDASDNYPGVAGIGPKTASDLIAKYGTLENVYKHLGEISENTAKKLAEGAESAGLGKKLATIVCDVPGVHLDIEGAQVSKIDWEQGVDYMRGTLGFKSLPERIEKEFLNRTSKPTKKNEKGNSTKASEGGQMKLI